MKQKIFSYTSPLAILALFGIFSSGAFAWDCGTPPESLGSRVRQLQRNMCGEFASLSSQLSQMEDAFAVSRNSANLITVVSRVNYPGNNLSTPVQNRVTTAFDCSLACSLNPECAGFTFFENGPEAGCWPKSNLASEVYCPNCLSGHRAPPRFAERLRREHRRAIPTRMVSPAPGINYVEGTISTPGDNDATTLFECALACREHRQCAGYTWFVEQHASHGCWLKSRMSHPTELCGEGQCVSARIREP